MNRIFFKLTFFSIMLFLYTSIKAQNSYINNRISLKSSVSSHSGLGIKAPHAIFDKITPAVNIEFNYGIFDFLEIGMYSGFSALSSQIPVELDEEYNSYSIETAYT